jgi:hypothetical protein
MGEPMCVEYQFGGTMTQAEYDKLTTDMPVETDFTEADGKVTSVILTDYEANYGTNEDVEQMFSPQMMIIKSVDAKYEYEASVSYRLPGQTEWVGVKVDHHHEPVVKCSELRSLLDNASGLGLKLEIEILLLKNQLPTMIPIVIV